MLNVVKYMNIQVWNWINPKKGKSKLGLLNTNKSWRTNFLNPFLERRNHLLVSICSRFAKTRTLRSDTLKKQGRYNSTVWLLRYCLCPDVHATTFIRLSLSSPPVSGNLMSMIGVSLYTACRGVCYRNRLFLSVQYIFLDVFPQCMYQN